MRGAVRLLAIAWGIEAIRVDDKELKEQLVELARSRSSSDAPPPKMSVLIIGNRKTGKSTICQWLLGKSTEPSSARTNEDDTRKDICKVYGIGQNTQKHEKFSGHWFNDPTLGELEVMDTKGFLSEGSPGADWSDLTALLKAEMSKIDAIIYTSSTTCEACGFLTGILNNVRRTFGIDLWENIIRTVNPGKSWYIAPGTTCTDPAKYGAIGNCILAAEDDTCDRVEHCDRPGGFEQSAVDNVKLLYDGQFEKIEFKEASDAQADWEKPENAAKKAELEKTIADTPYFAPFFTAESEYWPMVKASDPDWSASKGNKDKEYMKKTTNVNSMVELRQWIIDKRAANNGEQWDLESITPRFGPSIVNHPQEFTCGWPKSCNLAITGKYLSNADRMQVFPMDHECGTDFEAWSSPLPFDQVEVRPMWKNEDDQDAHLSRTYNLHSAKHLGTKAATLFKMCYCEYGNCGVPTRFFQEVGTLTIQSVQCALDCPSFATGAACGTDANGKQVTVLAREKPSFSCDFGYGVAGAATVKSYERSCNDDGVFTDASSPKSCSLVECKTKPALPKQAKRITSDNGQQYFFGTPVKFECDDGFTVDGNPQVNGGARTFDVVCGDDGEFDFMPGKGPAGESLANFKGCRRWTAEDWAVCAGTCGIGQQTREALCEPAETTCSAVGKPETSKECRTIQTCPNCGEPPTAPAHAKLAYRDAAPVLETEGEAVMYSCDYEQRYTLTGEKWRPGVQTDFNVKCKIHETEPRAVQIWTNTRTGEVVTELAEKDKICKRWETTEWGECDAICGAGYRTRRVQCSTGDNSDCPEEDMPQGVTLSRSCYNSKQCNEPGRGNQDDAALPSTGSPALLVWALVAAACVSFTR